MSNALVGATLGASLLIPLVLSMVKGHKDAAIAVRDLGQADESLIKDLETLKASTKGLTQAQDLLLASLLRVSADCFAVTLIR